jgi:cytidyltransferase-like protein
VDEPEEKVIVYVDMVGDMFHGGHVELFKKARAFGNYLLVGVNSDEDAKSYKRTPIMTLEERVKVIEACRYVDEVIPACPLRPTVEWLLAHNIKYRVHGDDFSPELLQDQYGASIELGMLRIVPYTPGVSSTNFIHRIIERYKQGEFQE